MTLKNTVVSRNPNIPWQAIQEKVVLVSPKTMQMHVLHGCGGRIWQHLESPRNINEIVNFVYDEYDVTKEQANSDVQKFVKKLAKENLAQCEN